MKLTVVRPSHAHSAYTAAAAEFVRLAEAVSGAECSVIDDLETLPEDGSPLIVIGTDAVNHRTMDWYFSRKIDGFGIRYGCDNYRIRSAEIDGRTVLFFAEGRPRAVLYAVYRYFEIFCGCRWFWDGDRIPAGELPLSDIDVYEEPRFEYRGLRYFAHRSLHRFQAEHWSLEDWKREIDWMLKKRLNLFMLRIGLDDLFQRAFPDIVTYPAYDKPLPEATAGYDDRTLFWPLEYRGELRKQLLAYAFARDLIHPEDCGTMTHWYSRTPLAFLEAKNPTLLSRQVSGAYSQKTGYVWDIRDDENLDNYFHLTETHIREYGKPELFHTIGLAERTFSTDREENLRLKLNVYRRICAYLRNTHPNAPLLLASWDFWMYYTPEEVRQLISELDPRQCILLDYTSDTWKENNFTRWGVVGKFPWIFGIFGGYEPNSEIRGHYSFINERLKLAKDDSMCKGLILWPELSHGDTFATEYLARNAWESETLSVEEAVDRYCQDRYSVKDRAGMTAVWHDFMPIVEMRSWSMQDGQSGHDLFPFIFWCAPFRAISAGEEEQLRLCAQYRAQAVRILKALAEQDTSDPMLYRDCCDIARTVIGRFLNGTILRAEQLYAQGCDPAPAMDAALNLNHALADLLSLHEDYSLYETLQGLRTVTDTNPDFEQTLKQNAENSYCRGYIYENARYLYIPEMELLFDTVKKADGGELDRSRIASCGEEIRKRFYETPLSAMQPVNRPAWKTVLMNAASVLEAAEFA